MYMTYISIKLNFYALIFISFSCNNY